MNDLSSLSDAELLAMAGGGGASASPLAHLSDEQLLAMSKPQGWMDTGLDVAKSAGSGLAKGAIGVATMIPQISSALNEGANRYLFDPILGKRPDIKPADAPRLDANAAATPSNVQKSIEGVTGDFHKPQTTAGKYAQTIGEFVPGAAIGPGGMLGNVLKYGVAPGIASEAAGQATQGTGFEPYARIGASLAAGGVAGMLGRPSIETRMTAQASRGAADGDISAATQLMQDAQARGVQLTWPEALQQVTNNGTQAGRLQRVVEGTKEGGAVMAPAMAQRPQQVGQAVNATLDRIAPASDPTRTAMAAQGAAESGIGRVSKAINSAEKPYYDAAKTRSVPLQDLDPIRLDPAFQQAFKNVRGDAIRNKDVASLPANDVATLIAVRKELGRMEGNAMQPGAGLNPDRDLARNISPVKDQLDQIISATSREYQQALGVGSGLRQQYLDPMKRGPVGQIAKSEDLQGQIGALFPARPMEGTANETRGAVQVLNSQDKTAAAALARQHLASTYAEAAQNNVPGANQWGGAKFAAQVSGNPLQRQTLEAGLSALPNGAQVAPDVRGLLQVLEATGKRQQPGSLTAFNASDIKDMGSAGLLSAVADSAKAGNPMPLLGKLKDGFDRARLGARSENIARGLLASPDDAGRLIRKAREASPDGEGARVLLNILLGGSAPARNSQPSR